APASPASPPWRRPAPVRRRRGPKATCDPSRHLLTGQPCPVTPAAPPIEGAPNPGGLRRKGARKRREPPRTGNVVRNLPEGLRRGGGSPPGGKQHAQARRRHGR